MAYLALNLHDNVHAADDLSEYNMFTIQPRGLRGREEKLRPVGVWPGVRHGQAALEMLDFEVLIREFLSIHRLSSGAIMIREVTTFGFTMQKHDSATNERTGEHMRTAVHRTVRHQMKILC